MNFIKRAFRGLMVRIKCLGEFIFFKIRFIYMGIRYRKKYEKLKRFKDIHKGERCFLIGTGPSLTDDDVLKLRGEYTFALNTFVKACERLNFFPTYYMNLDNDGFNIYGDDILKNKESIIFFPRRYRINKRLYELMSKKSNAFEFLMMEPGNWNYFSKHMPMRFADDITKSIGWGYTVAYIAYQIISYMGFEKIYLLGMDCSYPIDKDCYEDIRDEKMRKWEADLADTVNLYTCAHREAGSYLKKHGIRVYNSTKGGKLDIFKRIKLESIV